MHGYFYLFLAFRSRQEKGETGTICNMNPVLHACLLKLWKTTIYKTPKAAAACPGPEGSSLSLRLSGSAAGLKPVCRTDLFPSEMLFSVSAGRGSRVGIQVELQIQSEKPQPQCEACLLERDTGSTSLTSEAARLAVCLSFISSLVRARAWVSILLLPGNYLHYFLIYEDYNG